MTGEEKEREMGEGGLALFLRMKARKAYPVRSGYRLLIGPSAMDVAHCA